jgi:uncharacterized membrane protein
MFPWHQYILGLILICTGFLHFKLSKKCEVIVPRFIPARSSMVLLFGIFEMILGLMLITTESQNFAAWCIIFLMVTYLFVPMYWLFKKNENFVYPKWFWLICILFQIGISAWAYTYV